MMRTLCDKTEAISHCLALTKPLDNWRDFHRYFYQGAEATPPWYVATNEQITNIVRSRSYQDSISRRLKCTLNLLRAQVLGSRLSSLWASSSCSDNLGGPSLGCNSKATRLDPVAAPQPTRRASFGTPL